MALDVSVTSAVDGCFTFIVKSVSPSSDTSSPWVVNLLRPMISSSARARRFLPFRDAALGSAPASSERWEQGRCYECCCKQCWHEAPDGLPLGDCALAAATLPWWRQLLLRPSALPRSSGSPRLAWRVRA